MVVVNMTNVPVEDQLLIRVVASLFVVCYTNNYKWLFLLNTFPLLSSIVVSIMLVTALCHNDDYSDGYIIIINKWDDG